MYTPDKWVVLKIEDNGKIGYKVLAGWSGSYLEGQSWKINSGIVKVEEDGDYYLFYGNSGSVYKCHKNGYGTNLIMSDIINQALATGNVEVMRKQNFTKLIKSNE